MLLWLFCSLLHVANETQSPLFGDDIIADDLRATVETHAVRLAESQRRLGQEHMETWDLCTPTPTEIPELLSSSSQAVMFVQHSCFPINSSF